MRIPTPLLLLGASGCVPHAYITVLEPADVALPQNIQTLAVIDRSRPSNVEQGILGTIEGALTGEAIGADREAGRRAVSGVAEMLEASPRFEVVVPAFDREGQESNLFDRELSWDGVQKICKAHGADGLVSLEALDSDSVVHESSHVDTHTDANGREVRETVFSAERETRVLTGWRVYSVHDAGLLDDLRDYATANTWTEEGHTAHEALDKLPNVFDTVVSVGYESGLSYGKRIAPTYVDVARSYYAAGDDRLKEAKHYVKANDWEGAEKIWRGMLGEADPKIRGRAEFDLALALEVKGDIDEALVFAKKAAVSLHNGRSRNYVHTLEWRISDRARLEAQMPAAAPVEPPPAEPPPPVESPAPIERQPTEPPPPPPQKDGEGGGVVREPKPEPEGGGVVREPKPESDGK